MHLNAKPANEIDSHLISRHIMMNHHWWYLYSTGAVPEGEHCQCIFTGFILETFRINLNPSRFDPTTSIEYRWSLILDDRHGMRRKSISFLSTQTWNLTKTRWLLFKRHFGSGDCAHIKPLSNGASSSVAPSKIGKNSQIWKIWKKGIKGINLAIVK